MNINKKVGNIRLADRYIDILYTDGTSLVLTEEKGKVSDLINLIKPLGKLLGKTINTVNRNSYYKDSITYSIYTDEHYVVHVSFMIGGKDDQNSIFDNKRDSKPNWFSRLIRRIFG